MEQIFFWEMLSVFSAGFAGGYIVREKVSRRRRANASRIRPRIFGP